MKNNLRVVVDTNVLISGLVGITDSPSSHILRAFRNQQIILVFSPGMIEEIRDVINRERIVKLIKMTLVQREVFIEGLVRRSFITAGKQLKQLVSRDVKDDKVLACAVEGNADFIISGDEDLLVLKEFEGIKIVSPREFISIFRQS